MKKDSTKKYSSKRKTLWKRELGAQCLSWLESRVEVIYFLFILETVE